MDLLTTLGRQFHAAQELVRLRVSRNPNEVIEQQATLGERIADSVARFGGSWAFINSFAIILTIYTVINIALDKKAWDPYPFILLILFLSMLVQVPKRRVWQRTELAQTSPYVADDAGDA
jgi:uncharacterized membrane protein